MRFSYRVVTEAHIKDGKKEIKRLVMPTGLARIFKIEPDNTSMIEMQRILKEQLQTLSSFQKEGDYKLLTPFKTSGEEYVVWGAKLVGATN
ncbi:MAG: hypothetical protein ABIA78_00975 [archaeon]